MKGTPLRTHRNLSLVGGSFAAATALTTFVAGAGLASDAGSEILFPSVRPQHKAPGIWSPNVLTPELAELAVAHGSTRLENGTDQIPYYGYLGDGPLLPLLPNSTAEATKTEPDKNTYLVLKGQSGADADYRYGHRFLFQGHEGGAGYITRVNLDANEGHRVTLMASTDVDGNPLPTFDGSTYDPFAKRLLFTAEDGPDGGVWAATLGFPSKVRDVSGAFGRGGYEGVQNDSAGNVWLVEDVGGVYGAKNPTAKQPNSFVYRYLPEQPGNLGHGRLQALHVRSRRSGDPIAFHAATPDADITSADRRDLHTYGLSFKTRWVTVHDTATDGTAPFDANAAAKAARATPFKRPENGAFQPGSDFRSFFFTETGDTNLDTEAGAALGGYGALYRLRQPSPRSNTGTLSMFFRGNPSHTGLDNLAFFGRRQLVAVEDAGDTLHTQRDALDSAYLFDTASDYTEQRPVRILAEGRDPSATVDSSLLDAEVSSFQNDGDNEITGLHVSNGDPGTSGILGAAIPRPWAAGSRWEAFYTAQHGDNVTYQLIRDRIGE